MARSVAWCISTLDFLLRWGQITWELQELPFGLRNKLLATLLPMPAQAAGASYSMVFSAHDDSAQPSVRLVEISIKAAARAALIDLTSICSRIKSGPHYPNVWPGEHYKLLSGLVEIIQPHLVIEIGTYTGLSALSMKQSMNGCGTLVTFDVAPWNSFSDSALCAEDFSDGKMIQYVEDVTTELGFANRCALFSEADLIFVDAAKDGQMEQRILDFFSTTTFSRQPLIVFDDIRLWAMLGIWRRVSRPKLDLTSFGHWSGTGLIDWCG